MSKGLPPTIEPVKIEAQLPFDIRVQEAALGHLIREEPFLRRARGVVKYDWFGHGLLGTIWKGLIAFYDQFGRCPSVEELKKIQFGHLVDIQAKNEIFNKIDWCIHAAQEIALDVITTQCTLWLQSQLIKESAQNLERHYSRGDVSTAMQYVNEKFPEIIQANFDPDTRENFIDTKKDVMEKYVLDCSNACTTGCQRFDRAILKTDNPNAGGLMVGDFTVVMAPISKGKTSFLLTVAIHNILKGKDVLLLVHENVLSIKRRIMMLATKCPANELVIRYQNPDSFKLIQEWEERLQRHLVFIPMDKPGGTYIEDVVAVVQEQQKEWKRRYGKGFDLLVDDFPAKLLTRNRKKDEFRNQMYFIYAQFASLAATEKFHVLAAVQSNRDGARANLEGDRALGMEDTSEAWGIPQLADNFISINRSESDREKRIVKYYLAKCRGEDTGRTIICKSRFDFYQTHGDDLGEGACEVEAGWSSAIPEVAAGGVAPGGQTIPRDAQHLTSRAKWVAKQEAANVTPETLKAKLEAKLAEKQRIIDETAPAYCYQPEDEPPEPENGS